ncbi:MAG: hypothetical protein L0Z55_06640, partial [Planctomycetes bacterium]|nr:hypothetical protein [Planctomycetota bacterium]
AGADPSGVQALSVAVAHDAAMLTVLGYAFSPALQAMNGGDGPDFFASNIAPVDGAGIYVAALFSFVTSVELTFAAPAGVMSFDYETVPAALLGNDAGATTTLAFDNTLGEPDVENLIVVGTIDYPPTLANGTVTLLPIGSGFLRGDVDGDGNVNALLDALFVLSWQFNAGADPLCMDAADATDNGDVNALLDGLHLLQWQFNAGPAPPAPGTDACGADPTDDAVDCAAPPACG